MDLVIQFDIRYVADTTVSVLEHSSKRYNVSHVMPLVSTLILILKRKEKLPKKKRESINIGRNSSKVFVETAKGNVCAIEGIASQQKYYKIHKGL